MSVKKWQEQLKNFLNNLDKHSILIGVAAGIILAVSAYTAYNYSFTKTDCSKEILDRLFPSKNYEIKSISKKGSICLYDVIVKSEKGKVEVEIPVVDDYIIGSAQKIGKLEFLYIKRTPIFEPNVSDTPPKVDLYVMANCPYGNRAEDLLLPLLNNTSMDFHVHYMVYNKPLYQGQKGYKIGNTTFYALHGPAEVLQSAYEVCVYNKYGIKKWASFVIELNKHAFEINDIEKLKKIAKETAKKLGIDWNVIEKCVKEEAEKYLLKDMELVEKKQVEGSPTLFINDVLYPDIYTRKVTTEDLRKAICESYSKCEK
ncbi:NEQ330 [Nanoarchaeum equitans Kin4-M]|uniref:NEQ330 n=1 Tax=Nanoarchaeum equitans (strain Kin4-M) TaxID=228908 RepID=Q74NJ0_NANEQ|nr:NEQ330 [Nanoarchaeum equitans Kin4-M]